ncbi:unnamed protein product [Ectocarpus sp. CCAP 1310/34]|nr:unnamed protein product [Ectocarpus sp. CCAP 1310/34]
MMPSYPCTSTSSKACGTSVRANWTLRHSIRRLESGGIATGADAHPLRVPAPLPAHACPPCARRDEDLAQYYGLRKVSSKPTKWVLSRSSLGEERAEAHISFGFGLPAGWCEEFGPDHSWTFKKTHDGTPVAISVEKPGPGGAGRVDKITFHHRDVTADFIGLKKFIHTAGDLRQVLEVVDAKRPCAGIRYIHYGDDYWGRDAFGNVVRDALRRGQPPDMEGVGHFPGPPGSGEGSVSATLHVVGDEHRFRHARCRGTSRQDGSFPRCE